MLYHARIYFFTGRDSGKVRNAGVSPEKNSICDKSLTTDILEPSDFKREYRWVALFLLS